MLNEFGRAGTGNAIAIVEDDAEMRSMLKDFLVSLGYEVHAYHSAEEFLKHAASSKRYFSLMISDMQMPGMGGLELLEKMQKENISFPKLMMTASPSSKDERVAISLGACAYLHKPFPLAELIKRLGFIFSSRTAASGVKA
jgi:DNA-binding response OmpR family regulator